MSFISYDRNQIDLLGYSLDDFVQQDAKCRFVIKLVDRLDLTALYDKYSDQGADAFDPALMLATWFFSYSEGECRTRQLENKCKRDTHYIYISANLHPDHTSLSRFRKDHLGLISDYFVQLVQMAQEYGISDFSEIGIDGSKIQASCSRNQNLTSDTLEKRLTGIRSDIDAFMKRCDMAERHELPEENIDDIREKIKQLEAKEQQLIERQQQLHNRKKELKAEHRAKHSINIVEPDAIMMSNVNGDKSRPGYNAQISVDSKTHFIVANETVQDRNDQRQFVQQYKNITTNLGPDANRRYNVDSGYFASAQLEYLFENDIDAIINDPTPEFRSNRADLPTITELISEHRPLNRGDFRYHPDGNYYECPAGKKLEFVRRKNGAKRCTDLYQCVDCNGCPLRVQCLATNNKHGYRNISRDEREIYAERMSDKLKSEDAKERLRLRAMTVEPVFGNLKENLGFRRFRLRGIQNVKAEFNLMCIGHNINILFKHAQSRKKRAMMILSKAEKQLNDFFHFSILGYKPIFSSNQ